MHKHNSPVILLVEDNPDHQELFKANLQLTSFATTTLHCVTTFASAKDYLEHRHADIIFLDLSLPDSSINETLAHLGELTGKVPVIVSTSSDEKNIILDVINKGADECLPKSEMNDVMLERMIRFTIDRWQLRTSLENSQEKLTRALSHAGVGIWDYDPVNNILVWDDSMYTLYGNKAENFSGAYDAWQKGLHPEDRDRAEAEIVDALHGRAVFDTEFRILTQGGEIRHIKAKAKVFFDETGRASRMLGTNWDITPQKLAEQKLQALSRQHLALFMDSPDAYFILNPDGGSIADCNLAAARMLKGNRDQIIGHTPDQLSPPLQPDGRTSLESVPEKIQHALESGYTRFEWVHRRFDWEDFWSEVTISLIDYQNSQALLVAWRDISERKQLELTLIDQQNALKVANQNIKLLNSLVEDSGDPFYVLDVNDGYRVIFANTAACRHYGYSKETLLTMRVPDWDPDVDYAKLAELLLILKEDGHITITTRHRVASGDIIPVEVSINYLKNDSGEYAYGFFTDIREKLRIENAMREAKELAEQSVRTRTEFLANMSHEIRTPMNAIIGLSNLALNQPLSEQVRDYLEKINSSSEGLLGILNDILDLSKIEAGKLPIENQRFDLGNVIDNLQNLFSNYAKEKGLQFDTEVAADVPTDLLGDALRLQQILSNLLSNAIKFTDRGRVAIMIKLLQAEKSQAKLLFCVEDTGIGISQNDHAKLCQPFSQVDTSTTRRFGGTGLGLAICCKLLDLMGSSLNLQSTPGQGSSFAFELVFSVNSQKQQQKVTMRPKERKAGMLAQDLRERGKALFGARVLVAEDNRINQQVVEEFLKLSGIHVDIVNNGKEALTMLTKNSYDAVLMDIQMPEMDGIETTKAIRKNPKYKALPIFALTAGVTTEERDACVTCGMNDFINKPVTPPTLIDKLCAWIPPKHENIDLTAGTNDAQSAGNEFSAQDSSRLPHPQKPIGIDIPDDQTWPEIAGIDSAHAFQIVLGDLALFVELLTVYAAENGPLIERLKQQLRVQNWNEAARIAHKLAGQAGYLGAKQITDAAINLEKALKDEDDNIAELAEMVFNSNTRLFDAIKHWLNTL